MPRLATPVASNRNVLGSGTTDDELDGAKIGGAKLVWSPAVIVTGTKANASSILNPKIGCRTVPKGFPTETDGSKSIVPNRKSNR